MVRFLSSFLMLVSTAFILNACGSSPKPPPGYQPPPKSVGKFKVGKPYKISGKWYYPKESYRHTEEGIASWYGDAFHGKLTANGEIYDKFELTAAHRTLQIPSLVRVTNLKNGRTIVVRVNDRGPFAQNRVIDLSERSAELLGFKNEGLAKVRLQVLDRPSRQIASSAKRGEDTSGSEIALNDQLRQRSSSLSPPQERPLAETERQLARRSEVPGKIDRGRFMPDPVLMQQGLDKGIIFVQVGSFGNPANAKNLTYKLDHISPVNVEPVIINGARYHRVKLGPFQNMNVAHEALMQVSNLGYSRAMIVVN